MSWNCEAYIAEVQLDNILQSLAVPPNSKVNKTEFHNHVRNLVNWPTNPSHIWTMTDIDITSSINNYSDRFLSTSASPLSDLVGHIVSMGSMVMLGVNRPWWRILGYNQIPRLLPGELIGGIGEGIAGYWLVSERNWAYIIRPVGVTTDGIVTNNLGGWGPIEVKTTTSNAQAAKDRAIDAARELLNLYTHHDLGMHSPAYSTLELALSIGIRISNPVEVFCIEFRK